MDAALVVFTGGPHTLSRLRLARELLNTRPFGSVILTGAEFTLPNVQSTEDYKAIAAAAPLITDRSSCTVDSCRWLRAELPRLQGRSALSVTAITSNYHAPRLRWLLPPNLPPWAQLNCLAARDLRWPDLFRSCTARKLIWGEIISWLYSLPLGLLWRLRRLVTPKPRARDKRSAG